MATDDERTGSDRRRIIVLGIVTSIAGTVLFLYLLDPIFSFLGRAFLAVAGFALSAYLDRMYSEIATGDISYGFLLFLLLGGSACVLYLFTLMATSQRVRHFVRRLRERSTTPGGLRRRKLIARTLCVLGLLLTLFALVDGYVRLRTMSTFRQHLTVVSPHIDEQVRKELLAQFASMRSRQDFRQVMARLADIARAKGITLPTNKLYP